MNEVKRSLDALAGDMKLHQEDLKQRLLAGPRKPKRRSPLPFAAGAIVLAAVLFLSFALLREEPAGLSSAYAVDENLYELILLNHQGEYGQPEYKALQQILLTDSLIDFAKAAGYQEDLPAIEKQSAQQEQEYYSGYADGELENVQKTQLENFGYTFEDYFQHLYKYTLRDTAARDWLDAHPPETMVSRREVMDAFMQEHEREITAFMDKKHITAPPHTSGFLTLDVYVTSTEDGRITGVPAPADEAAIRQMTLGELEPIVTTFISGTAQEAEPYTYIRITYDPLSYPVSRAQGEDLFMDVPGWEEVQENPE